MTDHNPSGTLPFGANLTADGVNFRVWAPDARQVDAVIEGREHRLLRGDDGVHEATVAELGAGARYAFRLDSEGPFPDPYSRFQPDGVHGASEVIDPTAFEWHDDDWPGLADEGLVVYECHVGAMTPEGTYAGLADQLLELKRLGVTAIELMPLAECPGEHNWGYDGVDLFAPSHAYGRPDDLRRLVDAAHQTGLGVILDVVYNHLGPDGNYLRAFASAYFTGRHKTPWGDALNYDGDQSEYVRQLAIANACYWVREFRVDGFRLDATDAIIDDSDTHIIAELTSRAREAASPRSVVIVAEDARNDVSRIRSVEQGGEGLDGVWADDFHHEIRVLLTNARENYYQDYSGTTKAIARNINEGFGYQGEMSPNLGHPRGTTVTDEPARSFIFCIQNHDQVGNRPFGERLHHEVPWDRYAVASTLLLMSPETPMLFMGQEFAASTPFLYFTDHNDELGKLVTEGRRREFAGFAQFSDPAVRERIPDPQSPDTFRRSVLNLDEAAYGIGLLTQDLYRDALTLRATDPALITARHERVPIETTTEAKALALWFMAGGATRALVVNFGDDATLTVPGAAGLSPLIHTGQSHYGGDGRAVTIDGEQVTIPGHSAVLLG